jgi:hypothetical protein
MVLKLLINFASRSFQKKQHLNSYSGLAKGGFDDVIAYSPRDIDPVFVRAHHRILNQPRGSGYWLWKPYFIARTLATLQSGDLLFYCDAGAHFIHTIDPLIACLDAHNCDLASFALTSSAYGVCVQESLWTKRDAFLLMDADHSAIQASDQRLASFSLWRKSTFSLNFASEWLQHCTDPRLITDLPNQLGEANPPGFMEHRHDQSVFSVLSKKHGLPVFRDPSQFGNGVLDDFPNSTYPQLIVHSRRK